MTVAGAGCKTAGPFPDSRPGRRLERWSPRVMRRGLVFAAICWLSSGGVGLGQSADDQRCLQCHGQRRITTDPPEDLRVRVRIGPGENLPPRGDQNALYVTSDSLKASVHSGVSCVACHADAAELPHAARMKPANCGSCHAKAAAEVLQSAHADAAARGVKDAPRCSSCHGSHDVRRRSDPAARTYPLHVIEVCGACHSKHHEATPARPATTPPGPPFERGGSNGGKDGRNWVKSFLDSVHGQAVSKAGLIVAATCADCHGHHDIRPSADPRSSVNRTVVPQTCGRCHVGINEVFSQSVHGEAARVLATQPGRRTEYQHEPPVCTDCHSAHAITRAETPGFMQDIVGECGSCHAELYRSYRESYHGQVQRLGSGRAAKCSDCHGAHNIRRPSDPHSTLSAANRAATCTSCHKALSRMSARARANFVRFEPHSDYRDRHKDPILFFIWLYFMILMGVTFTFWGLHSIAWFVRGWINNRRSGPRPPHVAHGASIRRFGALNRWTHALVIVSFFGLTITGLPLKFSDQPWAGGLMGMLGGPVWAGNIHRFCAVLVVIYMAMHAIQLIRLVAQRLSRPEEPLAGTTLLGFVFGPHSMLPTARDWREFRQMAAWFFGRGDKPRFDRWTYWEKFDYWADAVGTFIIGGSGLLLWFPAFFAQYLSGYWLNVATVVHGYEALLAVGFIFTIHFFNAHLRWEKFPVDDVIFTGQVPEEEFQEERGAQYERMIREGEVDGARVPAAAHGLRVLARIVGTVSLIIGSVLVILIVRAGLK